MKHRYYRILVIVLGLLTGDWAPPSLASAVTGETASGGASGAGSTDPLAAVSVGQIAESGWQVRLELAAMPDDLRVTLNGRRADNVFKNWILGSQSAWLSRDDGLRHGRNVLKVAAAYRHQRYPTQTVTFTIPSQQPIAAAGADRQVRVHTTVRLNGRRSVNRAALGRVEWRVVSKPSGSMVALLEPGKLNTTFVPDMPGKYEVELRVWNRRTGLMGYDTATVTATPPPSPLATPLVPVDTAASVQGQRGIALGYHPAQQNGRVPQGDSEKFYPLGAGNALQIVVLDRATLQKVTTWSGPASDSGIVDLRNQLLPFDDSKLVIITAWSDPAWASVIEPASELYIAVTSIIGAGKYDDSIILQQNDILKGGGQLSFIGVPGFPAGKAWEVVGLPQGSGNELTTLNGFLSRDNNWNYAYLGTAPQGFDLGADGQSVALTIGGSTYTASLPAGTGGFTVVYINGKTLTPSPYVPVDFPTQRTYQTRNADGSPNLGEMQQMANDLQTPAVAQNSQPPLLIAIRSIGAQPLANWGNYQGDYTGALLNLAGAVMGVGGQAQWIFGMATAPQAKNSYSLIGGNFTPLGSDGTPIPAAAQGLGADLGTAASPTPSSTQLRGVLVRGKNQGYAVRSAANAPMVPALAQTVMAEPVAWPYADSPALRCIGNATGLGDDPRLAYWQQTYSSSKWGDIHTAIKNLLASSCPANAQTDFGNVQNELKKEITWLINVRSYVGSLSAPFTKGDGLTSYTDLQTVTDAIKKAITLPPQAPAGISGWSIFTDILSIAGGFDVPGASAIAGAMTLSQDLYSPSSGEGIVDYRDQVQAAADEIGGQLATQLETASANSQQLVDIIAADYAKLKTVGTLGGCDAYEANCPSEWQFTQAQQNAASRMYKISAMRQIWGGLMPAAYPYVLMLSSNPSSYNGTFMGPQDQISGVGCDYEPAFTNPGANWNPLVVPQFLNYGIPQVTNYQFNVFSQTDFKGANSPNTNFPPQSLFSTTPNLFGPLDPGGNPDKGGLGMDEYEFMVDHWPNYGNVTSPPMMKFWKGC